MNSAPTRQSAREVKVKQRPDFIRPGGAVGGLWARRFTLRVVGVGVHPLPLFLRRDFALMFFRRRQLARLF